MSLQIRKQQILSEDEFVSNLEEIIERDYFPELYQNNNRNECNRSVNVSKLSVDSFLANYTTEDNDAFEKLQEEDMKNRRIKYPWLYEDKSGRIPGMLMLYYLREEKHKGSLTFPMLTESQRIKVQLLLDKYEKEMVESSSNGGTTYDKRPAAPDSWKFQVRNKFMFPSESVDGPDLAVEPPISLCDNTSKSKIQQQIETMGLLADGEYVQVLSNSSAKEAEVPLIYDTSRNLSTSTSGSNLLLNSIHRNEDDKQLLLQYNNQFHPTNADLHESKYSKSISRKNCRLQDALSEESGIHNRDFTSMPQVHNGYLSEYNRRIEPPHTPSVISDNWSVSVNSTADSAKKEYSFVPMTPSPIPGFNYDSSIDVLLREPGSLPTDRDADCVSPIFTYGRVIGMPQLIHVIEPIATQTTSITKAKPTSTILKHPITNSTQQDYVRFQFQEPTPRDKLGYSLASKASVTSNVLTGATHKGNNRNVSDDPKDAVYRPKSVEQLTPAGQALAKRIMNTPGRKTVDTGVIIR